MMRRRMQLCLACLVCTFIVTKRRFSAQKEDITELDFIKNTSSSLSNVPTKGVGAESIEQLGQNQHENDLPSVPALAEHESTLEPPRIKYLLALQRRGNGGQNSQFLTFMKAIMFALLANRTLVMTPFFLHGGVTRGYAENHLRALNDTFDVQILGNILPLVTIDRFKAACNGNNTKVISWGPAYYQSTSVHTFKDILGIDLPSPQELVQLQPATIRQVEETVSHTQCLALYQPRALGLLVEGEEEVANRIRKHVTRPRAIRDLAGDFEKKMCDDAPYLAMHWRNKTSETPCYFGKGPIRCKKFRKEMTSLAESVSVAVAEIMKQNNLTCLFVACPQWSLEILDHLEKHLPRDRIFVSSDFPRDDTNERILRDAYSVSLLEQEMCYRSKIFLCAKFSNWSTFVKNERTVNGKITHFISELPGIPEYSRHDML